MYKVLWDDRYIDTKDIAFQFYYKAEKMYEKLKDNLNLGRILINKANLQFIAGDYFGV
jgi:hypothetical protein